MPSDLGAAAGAVGALEDELRRHIYLFIRRQGRPVTRDEAAREVRISRKLAAFHLDKLVEKGVLQAHYARPPGRSGPGAGRTSKFYEPADAEIAVSLPPRRYDFVGDILVEAIEARRTDESSHETAQRVAFEVGVGLGRKVREKGRLRPLGPERALAVAEQVLSDHGYEPYAVDGGLRLRNCPFHALSQKAPDLICGLNRSFVDGLLRGLGNESVEALLDRRPGECCIHLRPRR
jgi:predicted ArsR family transcriptional regulator